MRGDPKKIGRPGSRSPARYGLGSLHLVCPQSRSRTASQQVGECAGRMNDNMGVRHDHALFLRERKPCREIVGKQRWQVGDPLITCRVNRRRLARLALAAPREDGPIRRSTSE